MAKGAAEQRKAEDSAEAKRTDAKRSDAKRSDTNRPDTQPAKIGHPYRRRLNSKGDRQG
jgi:hypothetical protein